MRMKTDYKPGKFKFTSPKTISPSYPNPGSRTEAYWPQLYEFVTTKEVIVAQDEQATLKAEIIVTVPEGQIGILYPAGLPHKGLFQDTSPLVFDDTAEHEIIAIVRNLTNKEIKVTEKTPFMRLALIPLTTERMNFQIEKA